MGWCFILNFSDQITPWIWLLWKCFLIMNYHLSNEEKHIFTEITHWKDKYFTHFLFLDWKSDAATYHARQSLLSAGHMLDIFRMVIICVTSFILSPLFPWPSKMQSWAALQRLGCCFWPLTCISLELFA